MIVRRTGRTGRRAQRRVVWQASWWVPSRAGAALRRRWPQRRPIAEIDGARGSDERPFEDRNARGLRGGLAWTWQSGSLVQIDAAAQRRPSVTGAKAANTMPACARDTALCNWRCACGVPLGINRRREKARRPGPDRPEDATLHRASNAAPDFPRRAIRRRWPFESVCRCRSAGKSPAADRD